MLAVVIIAAIAIRDNSRRMNRIRGEYCTTKTLDKRILLGYSNSSKENGNGKHPPD
jgi:hypothetical protein